MGCVYIDTGRRLSTQPTLAPRLFFWKKIGLDQRRPTPAVKQRCQDSLRVRTGWYGSGVNDPSAGSPTETLLRLLLPLNDEI